MHARRGQPSNRNLDEKIKQKVLEILSRDVYRGFGTTLAAECLASKHGIGVMARDGAAKTQKTTLSDDR